MLTQQRRQNLASRSSAVRKQQGGIAFRPPVQFVKTAAGTVQRYISNDLGGAVEPLTYKKRADAEDMGLNGRGDNNNGWAKIVDENNKEEIIYGISAFNSAHTEESLLTKIKKIYGEEIYKNDPSDTSKKRVTEIYTERRPCGADGEKPEKSRQDRNEGSCDSYLKKNVHANVIVSFSVENSSKGFNLLKSNITAKYYDDIVKGTRLITASNMKTRNGSLYHQFGIRSLCYEKYKFYGRDYDSEYKYFEKQKEEVDNKYKKVASIINVDESFKKEINEKVEDPHMK